jgi:hypothetical protein
MSNRSVGGFEVPKGEGGTSRSQQAERQERAAAGGGWSGGGSNMGGSSPGGGHRGGGCFPAGTMIATPAGDRDIATLSPGDRVLAFDPGTGRVCSRPILKVSTYRQRRTWLLRLAGGRAVRTTGHHLFRTETGWRQASALAANELVVGCDGGLPQMTAVTHSEPDGAIDDVFTLVVEGHFTFVAAGLVVHGFTTLRRMRELFWRVRVSVGRALAARSWGHAHIDDLC